MSEPTAKQLRIALFTGNYNYVRDGVAVTLNRLVAYLERRGIAVLIFAPTTKTPAFEATGELVSVPSFPIPRRKEYRMTLGLPKSARVKLEDFKPNLFLLAAPDALGHAALKLAAKWKIPAVASYHTRYDTYLKFYGLGLFESMGRNYLRRFYARCKMVYPPSQSMANTLREQGIATNLQVWGRGVDSDLFNPSKRSLKWRRDLGITDTEVVVSFVSRLVKEKNTDLLVRIFLELQRKGVALRPLIVGNGPEETHLRNALPAAIFTGFLQGEDLARAYASSDIFLFPSESETFGNVSLEAMASGLPTICADATGSSSLVVDGITGYLESTKNEIGFVTHVTELIQNPNLRAAMGNAARTRALEFRWDGIMDKLVLSFSEIAKSQSTAP
jgi:glycosyltransferase involved in cell wall biosynthesis